ncbi:MAG TPA: nitronate monooxygenase [Burkholderiales bacterium]|nr:nitronate monooxygenase [Burkholderiales bacterium]
MKLERWLGIEYPVVQAPMAGSQGSRLAIAVSQAGGLGSLPCAMLSVEAMKKELEAIRAATDKPYNVNFFCHAPPVPDSVRETRWREVLGAFYREFGIDPAAIPAGPGRSPFSSEAADALEPFRPAVVSFHFGLPAPELVARVKGWGTKVMASATTVDEARWLEARGADAIIAQGVEAGGHRGIFLGEDLDGQPAMPDLLRGILKAVKVPVIAAGGIADAQGVREAMSLGAAGVQVGTAYLLCPEATTSEVHRTALRRERRDTALTNLFTGRPARGIVNRLMREAGPLSPSAPAFPLATAAIAPLRAAAEKAGSGEFSPLWCGQYPGRYRELPAAQLTRELGAAARRA